MDKNGGYTEQTTYTIHTGYPTAPPLPPTEYAQPPQVYAQPPQVYAQPQQVYAPPIGVPPQQLSWFERNSKNKPQSNSVGAAAMVFLAGGMQMAWGCGFSSYTFFAVTTNVRIGWYIGAIIGGILGAVLNNSVKRKFLLLFSIALIMMDGVIMVAASRQYAAVTAARYLDGFAFGLVFVPAMTLVGENSVRYLRGMLSASIELMCYYLGIALQITYAMMWTYSMSFNFNIVQMMGTMNLMFGAIGLLVLLCLYVESPVYHLVRGEEEQAIDCLRRLQRPHVVTTETYEQLNAHRSYIAANKEMSLGQSARQGLPALFLMIFFRSLVALTFSEITVGAMELSSRVANAGYLWDGMIIFYGYLPFLGSLIGVFLLDSWGRRKPIMKGAVVSGGMAIGLGVLFSSYINLFSNTKMLTAMCLLLVFQLFAAFYTISSSAYLTEAFPMAIKPYYIAIPLITQMIVQLIITCCSMTTAVYTDYFYVIAAFSLFFVIVAVLALPETSKTTLLEAQGLFKRPFRIPRN